MSSVPWRDIDAPFCVTDRIRMRRHRTKLRRDWFFCGQCGENTTLKHQAKHPRRGRPLKEFDHTKASDLLGKQAIVEVAKTLGVHRNTLYRRVEVGLMQGRAFRTRIPRTESNFTLYWPYLASNDPRYDGVVRKVNEAVPRTLLDAVRSDICQDILLAVLSGELSEDRIRHEVKAYISGHYKLFPVLDFRTRSLDAVVPGTDLKLIDTLDAERIADTWAANRLTAYDHKTAAHFQRPPTHNDRVSSSGYDRIRAKYQLVKGRVLTRQIQDEAFGGSWTIERALPEEIS